MYFTYLVNGAIVNKSKHCKFTKLLISDILGEFWSDMMAFILVIVCVTCRDEDFNNIKNK